MLLRSGRKLASLTMENGVNSALPLDGNQSQVEEPLNDGDSKVGGGLVSQDNVLPNDGLLNGLGGGVPQDKVPLNNGTAFDAGGGDTHKRDFPSPTLKPDDVASRIADDAVHRFVSQADAVTDDIYDFLDENPINEIRGNVSDLDRNVSKMEELRSQYRTLHKELKRLLPSTYQAEFGQAYKETLEAIKGYIKDAKNERAGTRSKEANKTDGDKLRKSLSVKLMIDNGERIMTELRGQFAEPLNSMTDQELSRRLAELPEIIRKVDSIATKFPDMMTNCKDLTDELQVKQIHEDIQKVPKVPCRQR